MARWKCFSDSGDLLHETLLSLLFLDDDVSWLWVDGLMG
jgi:hypothetical protein